MCHNTIFCPVAMEVIPLRIYSLTHSAMQDLLSSEDLVYRLCHVHPLVVVHAPASCGRGLEGDGRSILEVMRRRRRRHAKSSENV